MNRNGLIYTILFSFVVTFAFVFLLSLANAGTIEIVKENEKVNEYRAVLAALGIEFEAGNNQDIIQKYEQVKIHGSGDNLYYEANLAGETFYALPYSGPGLWGTISAIMGVTSDLSRITGLTLVSHAETPGLGGRIDEPWFAAQFAGQALPESGVLTFKPGVGTGDPDKDDSAVDAITGATRTTEGIASIVQNATLKLRALVGGNQ